MDHPVFATSTPAQTAIEELRDHVLISKITAASRGVPLVVSLHGPDGVEELTVEPCDVRIDDDCVLSIKGSGFSRSLPLHGEGAAAILPDFVPADERRRRMLEAAAAMAGLRTKATMLDVQDGHGHARVRPDMVVVASTGIYPAGALGVDWEEATGLTTDASMIGVRTAARTLELRAA